MPVESSKPSSKPPSPVVADATLADILEELRRLRSAVNKIDRRFDAAGIDLKIFEVKQEALKAEAHKKPSDSSGTAVAPVPKAPPSAPASKVAARPKTSIRPPVGVAVVGTRGHGLKHIEALLKLPDCRIVHVCDVDSKVGHDTVEHIHSVCGHRPRFTQDIREMLKDPEVEAVTIATPHHWHALATVWALRAGKHVYLEKPVTHSYAEGPVVLAAARKYGRLVQAGTQLRSNTSLRAAGEFMKAGGLGDLTLVHCVVHKDRPPTPRVQHLDIPASINYDLWCGPAEMSEVTRSKFHYHWHWQWRFGNGALGNNGIHRIDAARIALGLQGLGDLVLSVGGRYGEPDSGETPNNMLTVHRFGKLWVLQDILGLSPKPYKGLSNAVIFYGTKGTIVYKSGHAALVDQDFKEIRVFEGAQLNHHQNFLDAVKSGDPSLLRGDLGEAVLSSDLCHLGNISYCVGQPSTFEAVGQVLTDLKVPPFVHSRLRALRDNLKQNAVEERIVLGDVLRLTQDPAMPIKDHPAAAALLKTRYREGFELPSVDAV